MYLAYRFWLTVEDDTDIAQKDRGFYTQLLRCGTGCGRIFAIIMKDATEDDIGESYLEDRMWPCVTSAMFQIWNTEDHHIPSPFMENWANGWHMGYR